MWRYVSAGMGGQVEWQRNIYFLFLIKLAEVYTRRSAQDDDCVYFNGDDQFIDSKSISKHESLITRQSVVDLNWIERSSNSLRNCKGRVFKTI